MIIAVGEAGDFSILNGPDGDLTIGSTRENPRRWAHSKLEISNSRLFREAKEYRGKRGCFSRLSFLERGEEVMAARLKERGGGGGKVMALQPSLRSALDGTPKGKVAARRAPSVVKEHPGRTPLCGKENARAVSRGKVAPGIAQIGEKEQMACARWSTSSLPKGKSSNPSDFARLMADFRARGGAPARHSVVADVRVIEGIGKVATRERRIADPCDRASPVVNKTACKLQQPRKTVTSVDSAVGKDSVASVSAFRLTDGGKSTTLSSSNSRRSVSRPRGCNMEKIGEKIHRGPANALLATKVADRNSTKVFPRTKESGSCEKITVSRQPGPSAVHKLVSCQEGSREEKSAEAVRNKEVPAKLSFEPSFEGAAVSCTLIKKESEGGKAVSASVKLQEKLAFLEGKVQRIASDIQRTKDLLESNDPTASKLLLSNIKSKISGIEDVVSHVMIIADPKSTAPLSRTDEFSPGLEDRLFPRRELLRNRTLSPAEENPIALEFLASLEPEKLNLNKSAEIQQTGPGASEPSKSHDLSVNNSQSKDIITSMLALDEKIEDFDDRENKPAIIPNEEIGDPGFNQLLEIGSKPSTSGWFVSEGGAALLAHSDGSCSFFDIVNNEGKAMYHPPVEVSSNLWGDCWTIRAPGVDGSSGRFVVAASAGNSFGSGFCSWDFYSREVSAFRIEGGSSSASVSLSRPVLAPLSGEHKWWYRPCGPLLVAAASGQRKVNAFDIRDGELVMTRNLQSAASTMEYSSPLQWRSRGKLVIAEAETVRLWDVNSLSPQPLLSIATGKKVNALHVSNTDAELGGGVRDRPRSSDVERNDGVFSTEGEVNIIDLRIPSGVGLKMPKKSWVNAGECIFSQGDYVYLGCSGSTPSGSEIQHFSLRKGKVAASYKLPKVNASCHESLTQVWGNASLAMGISRTGLFVFDEVSDEHDDSCEVVGPDDLCCPSFDFVRSKALIISRDRPAMWRLL